MQNGQPFRYPTTRQELLASPFCEKDDFFFAATLHETSQGYYIDIVDRPLIARNDKIAQQVKAERGVILPTRAEVNDGKTPFVTLGAGSLVVLKQGYDHFMPLIQRDAKAPTNPNRWANFSGLVSHKTIADTIESELREEMGLINIEPGKKVTLFAPYVYDDAREQASKAASIAQKQKQLSVLQHQLPAEHRHLPVEILPLALKVDSTPPAHKPVYIRYDEKSDYFRTCFHFHHQPEKHAVTLSAKLTGQVEGRNLRPVDLEGFGRHAAFFNPQRLMDQAQQLTASLAALEPVSLFFRRQNHTANLGSRGNTLQHFSGSSLPAYSLSA
jgi:hypothetical protein